MTLGNLIRLTREAKGLTLRAVAEDCGLSNTLISQIETGWAGDLSLHNAAKLGKTLGLSLDEMASTKMLKKTRRNAVKMRKLRKGV